MKAIILSGGLGTRLRPFTDVIPKPLLPIGDKALLEIQIEQLRDHGFAEIFLATNYRSSYIENFFGDGSRFGVSLTISKEDKPLGTAGPVKLLQATMSEPFLVINGDILTLLDYHDFYQYSASRESLLTVCTKEIITSSKYGNIYIENETVVGIEEKPDRKNTVLAGIYFFRPAILDLIPVSTYFGMDNLIIDLLSKQMPITYYDIKEFWLDIGTLDDYETAQNRLKDFISNK